MKKVKFKRCSFGAYQLLNQKDPDAIYFILDKPFIYMNGVQYGMTLDAPKHLINSLSWDEVNQTLVYTIAGSTESFKVPVKLPLASELNDGLMSKEQVKKLNHLVASVGDIESIPEYVVEKSTEVLNTEMTWTEVTK